MEDLTDIKNIWRGAKADKLPSAAETVRFIKRYRFRQILKKTAWVLMMLLMASLMLRAAVYGSNILSARIGELFIFIGYLVLIFSNANSLRRAVNQVNRSNQEFIEYLEQAQRGRLYFYEKVQPFTFVVMASGLFLYVYEMVRRDFNVMLTAYSLLTIGLLIMWFFIRPLIYKKRTQELKETITKLDALQKAL